MNLYFADINNDIEQHSTYLIYNPTAQATKLPFQVSAGGSFYCNKNYRVHRSGFEYYLLIFTLAGIGEIEYRGCKKYLHPGDFLLIDCREEHIYATFEDSWSIKWIRFNCLQGIDYHGLINGDLYVILKPESISAVDQYLDNILRLLASYSMLNDLNLSNQISNLLTTVCLAKQRNAKLNISVGMRKYIYQLTEYIEAKYKEQIRIKELALEYHLSEYTLIKLFKKQNGITPYEYLLRRRVAEAGMLLETSSYSVGEIAQIVGFNNINGFIRKFKQITGTTPLQYRQLHI